MLFCSARSSTLHQLVIDSLDLWIPATNLGYSSLNDGWLGGFGLAFYHSGDEFLMIIFLV